MKRYEDCSLLVNVASFAHTSPLLPQCSATQAEFAKRSSSAFRNAEDKGAVIEVFFHLHHFLIHAANIDRILDMKPGSERHSILNGHLDLSGVDLKSFRHLRNHLEHFDERLDQWVRDFEGHALFDMHVITGAKGFPVKAYLRTFDGGTFKFHRESYNMAELCSTILEVDRQVTSACS